MGKPFSRRIEIALKLKRHKLRLRGRKVGEQKLFASCSKTLFTRRFLFLFTMHTSTRLGHTNPFSLRILTKDPKLDSWLIKLVDEQLNMYVYILSSLTPIQELN